MWLTALYDLGLVASGLLAWSLIEYAVHGWMGHRSATFVTPIHATHHCEPHAVFAIGAWIPSLIPLVAGLACGARIFALIYGGALAGFAFYEALHYRIHFRRPSCRLEARLRARHLTHHHRSPKRCYGVTTPLWDYIFGTLATDDDNAWIGANADRIAPLEGPSNFGVPNLLPRRIITGH